MAIAINPFRSSQRRWRIAWLLALGVLVNYFDRVNLSVSHDALITTFGISSIAFGYLSSAYNWTYAVCQLPIGILLDKFGIRRIGRISTFLWSLASFGAAITPGTRRVLCGAIPAGRGRGSHVSGQCKAIGHWFPPQGARVSRRSSSIRRRSSRLALACP